MQVGHLTVSRKQGSSVTISLNDGRMVKVTVAGIKNDKVYLTIAAPIDLHIVRDNAINKAPRPRIAEVTP